MSHLIRLATLALLATALAAQATQRRATAGRICDADGKPVAGASVTFVGAPLPILDPWTDVDRVEVRSDAAGSFTAMLLPRADYSAWAAARTGDAMRVSVLRRFVAAGDALVLATTVACDPLRVRVTGLEDWAARGPCTASAAPCLDVLALQPVAIADDTIELPPFTGSWCVLVRDAAGRVIHAGIVDGAPPRESGRGVANPAGPRRRPPRNTPTLDLLSPSDVLVRILDEADAPVAGADVAVGFPLQWYDSDEVHGTDAVWWERVGVSDARGQLALQLAVPFPSGLGIVARAAGHDPAFVEWPMWRSELGRAGEPEPTDEPDVTIRLAHGNAVAAHLCEPGRRPHRRVLPRFALDPAREAGAWRFAPAADGAWLPEPTPEGPVRVFAWVPDGACAVRALAMIDPSAQRELDIADLATLRLRTPAGAAAREMRVLLEPVPGRKVPELPPITTFALSMPATLRLGIGRWRLLASDGEQWASHELDLLPGVTDLELALRPLDVVQGRVAPSSTKAPAALAFTWRRGLPGPVSSPSQLEVQIDRNEQLLRPVPSPRWPRNDLPTPPEASRLDDATVAMANWLAARATIADDGRFTVRLPGRASSSFRLYLGGHELR